MKRITERFFIAVCVISFVVFACAASKQAHGQVPATSVTVWGLQSNPGLPPLFGPVLTVNGADGTQKLQINTLGDIWFQQAATIQFSQTTLHAGRIRGFVYVKMPDGELALMPVFALPGDTREFGVSIDF